MRLVFEFLQTCSTLIVLAYLLSRANFFARVNKTTQITGRNLFVTAAIFLLISLYGKMVYALSITEMYVDTRLAAVTLAGLLFGYSPAAIVAVLTGAASALFGEVTLWADLAALALAWGLSGLCHRHFPGFDAVLSGIVVGVLEIAHMLLIVFLVRPLASAKELIYAIGFPMIVINGLASIGFVLIIHDVNERKQLWEKETFSRSEGVVARNLQRSLLISKFDVDPRLDLTAFLTPTYAVGGDLYSFVLDRGRYFKFILGDVSGKGVPAAITMSRCETLFRELVHLSDDPAQTMTEINRRLAYNNETMMFITACIGCFDLQTGRLVYSNAGHVDPYLVEQGRPVVTLPKPKGISLGILEKGRYRNEEVTLLPGQYFFTYTDGITEAENMKKELYGNPRLENVLSGLPTVDAPALEKTVLASVKEFTGEAEQSDDIALFTFGRPRGTLYVALENTLPAWFSAAEEINAGLKASGLSQKQCDDIALVLEEIASNIIKFGYADGRAGKLEITVETGAAPAIIIVDDSDPFDPFTAASPNAELPPQERMPGGFGIFLTKKRIVSHSYSSDVGQNTLIMKIRS